MSRYKGSVVPRPICMSMISAFLFWLPFVGPFISLAVVRKPSRAVGLTIVTLFLPGSLFALALLFFTSSLSSLPTIGVLAGIARFTLFLIYVTRRPLRPIVAKMFAVTCEP